MHKSHDSLQLSSACFHGCGKDSHLPPSWHLMACLSVCAVLGRQNEHRQDAAASVRPPWDCLPGRGARTQSPGQPGPHHRLFSPTVGVRLQRTRERVHTEACSSTQAHAGHTRRRPAWPASPPQPHAASMTMLLPFFAGNLGSKLNSEDNSTLSQAAFRLIT